MAKKKSPARKKASTKKKSAAKKKSPGKKKAGAKKKAPAKKKAMGKKKTSAKKKGSVAKGGADVWIRRGRDSFDKGNYDQAIKDFSKAIKLANPVINEGAFFNRGCAYYKKGNFKQAIEDFIKVTDSRVSAILTDMSWIDEYSWKFLYMAYRNIGDFDQAIKACAVVVSQFPDDPKALSQWAEVHAEEAMSKKKAAEKKKKPAYSKAPLAPRLAVDTCLEHGAYNLAKSNFDCAIKDFSNAIKLEPEYPIPWWRRGFTYLRKAQSIDFEEFDGDFAEAEKIYVESYQQAISDCSEAIRLDPDSVIFWVHRGDAYFLEDDLDPDLGSWRMAFSDYSQALLLSPDEASIYFRRAKVWRRWWHDRGRPDWSLEDCKAALRLEPDDVDILLWRAGYLEAWESRVGWEEAIKDYTEVIKILTPAPSSIKTDEADELAGVDLDQLIYAPKRISSWSGRGRCYMERGDYKKAIKDFTAAIRLSPDKSELLKLRGEAYQKNGNLRLAKRDALRAEGGDL